MSLQQLLVIFWARKNLIIAYLLVTMITTLTISLILPKQYIANTTLVLDQPGINPITGVVLRAPQVIAGYMATQTDIITSPTVALSVVDILELTKDTTFQAAFEKDESGGDFRNWIAEGLMQKLEVMPSRESSILGISFSATDPEFAAKVANAFAQAYMQTADELKRQPAQQTADWFDGQLMVLRDRMEKAREKLSNFQQTHSIIAMTNEQIDLEDAKLTELSNKLVENQIQTTGLLSKKKQLEAIVNPEELKSLTDELNDRLLQELQTNLAHAEAKFADLAVHVDRNHPQYRQAAAEISNLKKQIKAETNAVLRSFNSSIEAAKNRDENLNKALSKQKQVVLQLKNQHDEIAVLSREVQNAQLVYDETMKRSIQMRMESEIRQSSIAVLDQAIAPKIANTPKVKLNMILSIFLGSILGLGAALVAEIMDRRVRSPIDIIDALDLPVFGVITATRPPKKFAWSFGVRS